MARIFIFLSFLFFALPASSGGKIGTFGPLKGVVFGSGTTNAVVVLHGDSGPSKGYESFAASVANANRDSTVIAMIRPGFSRGGVRSPGEGGKGQSDLFTKGNNDKLAKSLDAVRGTIKPGKLIVIGHSGGAGQLGSVIGRFPGRVDTAMLVSCPCNVPAWRIHRRGKNNWKRSQSPDRFTKKIDPKTKVYLIVGENDANTRPRFSEGYAKKAKSQGKDVDLLIVPGGEHKFRTLSPTVSKVLKAELN